MNGMPKVLKVYPGENKFLRVLFDNGVEKLYDCKPIIERFNLSPLLNDIYFKHVHADPGRYGISWSADMDLSEYELWTNGAEEEKHCHITEK
jgi:hypothetical protein